MLAAAMAFLAAGCKEKEAVETVKQETALETPAPGGAPAGYAKTGYYFKLPNYKGGDVDLETYAGKPVLVMFFTENCPYCRKAAPFINSVHEKYASKGLPVIGISVRDGAESARGFAEDFNLKFDLAYKGGPVSRKYGIQGVPFIYLLDKNHERIKTWPGYDESYDADIEAKIQKVI